MFTFLGTYGSMLDKKGCFDAGSKGWFDAGYKGMVRCWVEGAGSILGRRRWFNAGL